VTVKTLLADGFSAELSQEKSQEFERWDDILPHS